MARLNRLIDATDAFEEVPSQNVFGLAVSKK